MNELEERWRDLGEFIREQRHVGQLSLRKLSEMAGISNPYLSQIERGMRKPSAEILRQIAGALHISAETLYVRAGILDERDGEADLVADIRRDPFIDEEQKKALVHIYESFRSERAVRAGGELSDDAVSLDDVRVDDVRVDDVSVDQVSGDVADARNVSPDPAGEAPVSAHGPGARVSSDAVDAGSDGDPDTSVPPDEAAADPSRLLTDA